MKSTIIYKSLLALAAPMLLAACSSTADEPTPSPVPEPETSFEGIILNIPNNGMTRADESDLSKAEKAIGKLVILAYDASAGGNTDKPKEIREITKDVNGSNIILAGGDNYSKFPITLPSGDYYIYVLANIEANNLVSSDNTTQIAKDESGNSFSWNNISKDELDEARLKMDLLYFDVDASKFKTPNDTYHNLPMTCGYKAIRSTESTGSTLGTPFTNGIVSIPTSVTNGKKFVEVYADMLYCHAKVRYTILNPAVDQLAFKDGGRTVYIKNYAKIESAVGHLASTDEVGDLGNDYVAGKYYTCPKFEKDELETMNLDNLGELQTSKPASNWAYQGYVYVPERLFASDVDLSPSSEVGNKVNIYFDFNLSAYAKSRVLGGSFEIKGDNTGKDETLNGVVRGVYYDVVGFTSLKELDLQVRVKNWTYHKSVQDLED